MVGFAMELAAWMFVGAVGIVVLMFVISVGLTILVGVMRCFELLSNYLHEDPPKVPWIPPNDSYLPEDRTRLPLDHFLG